ncbi:MAG: class I SAM-dependent methyltransferase [Myxococcota bacterium]
MTSSAPVDPALTDVPETMLWTLHNRAGDARRADGALRDPEAVRIYDALAYDYERSFGPAEPSHAIRSAMFDDALRRFLDGAPDGVIVNLGEGLETQRYRVRGDAALWLSVDVPEAIAIRERFIEPDDHHLHIAVSALDAAWSEAVPAGRPVFITAQGLFMYFKEEEVRDLFQRLSERHPGAYLMFDAIPRWLSNKTLSDEGWKKTEHYTTPPMPWGIDRHEMGPTLRGWVSTLDAVDDVPWWLFPRGSTRWMFWLMQRTPLLGRYTPSVTRVRFGSG